MATYQSESDDGDMLNDGEGMPEGGNVIKFQFIPEGGAKEDAIDLGGFNLEDFTSFDDSGFADDDLGPEGNFKDDDMAVNDDVAASSVVGSSSTAKDDWKKKVKEVNQEIKTSEELLEIVKSTRNENTVKKTNQVVTAFQKWLSLVCQEERAIAGIMGSELDGFLSNYLLMKKKVDGGEHEPDTLTSIHRSIVRHLRKQDYAWDPMKDKEFEMSRNILESKRIRLKKLGKGNKPNRAEPIDDDEMSVMWEQGVLGHSTPEILQNTVYLFFNLVFGLRGSHEARQMLWGDVELFKDANGVLYLQFTEKATKTRRGQAGSEPRKFSPKIFETKSQRCPLWHWKLFAFRRPMEMMDEFSPFYLTVKQNAHMNDDVCYTTQPMGVNTMNKIVAKMSKGANLPGKKSNHSLRKTTCTKLLDANVPPTMVAQLSGHKNLASLNNYSTASRTQQKYMSDLLTGKRKITPIGDGERECKLAALPSTTAREPSSTATVSVPAPAVKNSSPLERLAQSASGMFAGANINGSISLHFNYHVSSASQSNVNVSPRIEPKLL